MINPKKRIQALIHDLEADKQTMIDEVQYCKSYLANADDRIKQIEAAIINLQQQVDKLYTKE